MPAWLSQTYKAAEILSLLGAPFAISSVPQASRKGWPLRIFIYAAASSSALLAVHLGLRGGRL